MNRKPTNRLLIKENLSYPPIEEPKFYTPLDEVVFYEWLGKLEIVKSYTKSPDGLIVELISGPYEYNLFCDLVAIFRRYKLDMKQLDSLEATQLTPEATRLINS